VTEDDEKLITAEFLGLFIAFGADYILFWVVLGVTGTVPGWIVVAMTVLTLGFYGGWLVVRWRRLRDDEPTQPDPLETLRDRYAAGELSDEEFERRLDRLLDNEREERLGADEQSNERSRR
jgi:uncharacterized membrane protein